MPTRFSYIGGVLLNYRKFYKYALLLLKKNQQKFLSKHTKNKSKFRVPL